jgi:Arc/MetJ-type ribon-helix-helix transcriptional regulator
MSEDSDAMERLTLRVPGSEKDRLDELVDQGKFVNRSEAVRTAIRELLAQHETSAQRRDWTDWSEVRGDD